MNGKHVALGTAEDHIGTIREVNLIYRVREGKEWGWMEPVASGSRFRGFLTMSQTNKLMLEILKHVI